MLKDREPLRQARQRAKEIVNDNVQLKQLVVQAREKLKKTQANRQVGKGASRTIRTFLRMIKAYLAGEYKEIPWKSLLLMVLGLVYFIMPLDIVPDFIPVAGFVDDLSLVVAIGKSIQGDINDFADWERIKMRSHSS